MCLIVHRFYKSNLPNDVIDINKSRNADGFGIAWRSRDGGLQYAKYGPNSFDKFRKNLKRLDLQPDIEYTAHFRYATTGAPCRDLSHPFVYKDENEGDVLVFHNGIINIDAPEGESDTSQFVKSVLANLPSRWWKQPHYMFLVESAISNSRMILMTKTETIYINEDAWMTKGGIAYSTDPGGSHSKYKGATFVSYDKDGQRISCPPNSGKGDTTTKYLPSGSNILTPTAQAIIEARSTDEREFVDADDLDFDVQTWMHLGHKVESLGGYIEEGKDGTVEAICVECETFGEVYIIGGELFIDVPHGAPKDDEDEDEEDFLDQHMRSMDKRIAMYSH